MYEYFMDYGGCGGKDDMVTHLNAKAREGWEFVGELDTKAVYRRVAQQPITQQGNEPQEEICPKCKTDNVIYSFGKKYFFCIECSNLWPCKLLFC
jgi:hypothetical protein